MTLTPGRFASQTLDLRATSSQRGMPSTTVAGIGGVGFSPLHLPGLALWLDAADAGTITSSGGAVSQWNDKSGFGRNVSQATGSAQPTTGSATQNALNVLSFDGADRLVRSATEQLVDPGNGAYSAFAAASVDSTSGTRPLVTQDVDNGTRCPQIIYQNAATFRSLAFFSSTGNISDSTATISAGWFVLAGYADPSRQSIEMIGNGSSNGATGLTGALRTSANTIGVGGTQAGTAVYWLGKIAEVIVYSRALSPSERTQVSNYLNAKWAVY